MTILYDEAGVSYDSALYTFDGADAGGAVVLDVVPIAHLIGSVPAVALTARSPTSPTLIGRRPENVSLPTVAVSR